MPQRFYLPMWNGPLPLIPAYTPSSGGFSGSGWRSRTHLMLPVPSGATATGYIGDYGAFTYQTGNQATAGPINVGLQVWASLPLAGAQTISGTVKGQALVSESNLAADCMASMMVLVYSGDLQTQRGECYGGHTISPVSSEFATTLRNRKFPHATLFPQTLTSVSASDGDRIVVVFAGRKLEAAATGRDYGISIRTSNTDLAEDETTTATTNAPWVEFSNTFTFADLPPRRCSLNLMGIGVH